MDSLNLFSEYAPGHSAAWNVSGVSGTLGAVKARLLCVALILVSGFGVAPPAQATFDYLPLWPFATAAQAEAWRAAPAGQDWHADAAGTALRFARDFLGYNEIDRTTSIETDGDEAWVGVGALLPDDRPRTAAVVHLARFGDAPDAPWEVVGTRDSILTLDRPAYGNTVGPVIDAGGTISGVDESLRLLVLQSTQAGPLGESCCVPAGGQQQPWSSRVGFAGAQPGTVVLSVSTGGHVADVESFAVTGLRVG